MNACPGKFRFSCSPLATILLIFSCSFASATTATVRGVRGAPTLDGKSGSRVLRAGDKLPADTVIRTAAGERVDLTLGENGRAMSLLAESALRLEREDQTLFLIRGE